jgi:hypothetical protein
VRGLHAIDLMDADELASVAGNAELFVSILYVLCREQIENLGISPTQFGESMRPELLKPAAEAMCAAIVNVKPAWRKNRQTSDFLIAGGS